MALLAFALSIVRGGRKGIRCDIDKLTILYTDPSDKQNYEEQVTEKKRRYTMQAAKPGYAKLSQSILAWAGCSALLTAASGYLARLQKKRKRSHLKEETSAEGRQSSSIARHI